MWLPGNAAAWLHSTVRSWRTGTSRMLWQYVRAQLDSLVD
jgi:hypothetical protein